MTIDQFLAAAHVHSVKGGADPTEMPLNGLREALIAKRADLAMVQARSHVARVQINAIDRALARQP